MKKQLEGHTVSAEGRLGGLRSQRKQRYKVVTHNRRERSNILVYVSASMTWWCVLKKFPKAL